MTMSLNAFVGLRTLLDQVYPKLYQTKWLRLVRIEILLDYLINYSFLFNRQENEQDLI